MKNKTLIKISLAWALAGIFILIFVASIAEPARIKVSEMEQNIGKTILLSGNITKLDARQGTLFMGLHDESGEAIVVMFNAREIPVRIGDLVSVKGKVQEYRGELELVASEIYCVKCGT